jgi:hypothetical protein
MVAQKASADLCYVVVDMGILRVQGAASNSPENEKGSFSLSASLDDISVTLHQNLDAILGAQSLQGRKNSVASLDKLAAKLPIPLVEPMSLCVLAGTHADADDGADMSVSLRLERGIAISTCPEAIFALQQVAAVYLDALAAAAAADKVLALQQSVLPPPPPPEPEPDTGADSAGESITLAADGKALKATFYLAFFGVSLVSQPVPAWLCASAAMPTSPSLGFTSTLDLNIAGLDIEMSRSRNGIQKIQLSLDDITCMDVLRPAEAERVIWKPDEVSGSKLLRINFEDRQQQKQGRVVQLDFAHLVVRVDAWTFVRLRPFYEVVLRDPPMGDHVRRQLQQQQEQERLATTTEALIASGDVHTAVPPALTSTSDVELEVPLQAQVRVQSLSLQLAFDEGAGCDPGSSVPLTTPVFALELAHVQATLRKAGTATDAQLEIGSVDVRDMRVASRDYCYRRMLSLKPLAHFTRDVAATAVVDIKDGSSSGQGPGNVTTTSSQEAAAAPAAPISLTFIQRGNISTAKVALPALTALAYLDGVQEMVDAGAQAAEGLAGLLQPLVSAQSDDAGSPSPSPSPSLSLPGASEAQTPVSPQQLKTSSSGAVCRSSRIEADQGAGTETDAEGDDSPLETETGASVLNFSLKLDSLNVAFLETPERQDSSGILLRAAFTVEGSKTASAPRADGQGCEETLVASVQATSMEVACLQVLGDDSDSNAESIVQPTSLTAHFNSLAEGGVLLKAALTADLADTRVLVGARHLHLLAEISARMSMSTSGEGSMRDARCLSYSEP